MKALLLEDLVRTTKKSEEEVIEEMDRLGYESFHIAFGIKKGKLAFRKKRV